MSASDAGSSLSRAEVIRKQSRIIQEQTDNLDAQADASAIEDIVDGLIDLLEGDQ